ncbi:hypothetical protein AX774_g3085 [Zancudomyces culisetae]|uniref:Uncharacterized protein n=1 Tax=Zancudomyces culisetae TaxID=1213189 RepID=A0A1R1PR11_ZANCU|nr:hypothetical protein AX774_g3085 [Zancudomyces culisetae]|eukprot:OMH83410.1 hypothetical protein AX774_g3085 [Zancudomyces culisetae]
MVIGAVCDNTCSANSDGGCFLCGFLYICPCCRNFVYMTESFLGCAITRCGFRMFPMVIAVSYELTQCFLELLS